MNWRERSETVRLILSDVDGVLTDGGIVLDNHGVETKRFNIRDGLGVKLWRRAGGEFGLITARNSHVVQARASELGITLVRQGVERKLPAAIAAAESLGFDASEVCYIGDDLPDLPVIRWAGLGCAVGDAALEVRQHANLVTDAVGGAGAVREIVERVLKVQHRWDEMIRDYLAEGELEGA